MAVLAAVRSNAPLDASDVKRTRAAPFLPQNSFLVARSEAATLGDVTGPWGRQKFVRCHSYDPTSCCRAGEVAIASRISSGRRTVLFAEAANVRS